MAFSDSGVPSHTKHKSPQGGFAARAQGETFPLPARRTMKVDHLVPDVNRNGLRILRHLQSERAIERHHCFGVLHWKSDVVEASNIPRLRRAHSDTNTSH